MSYMLPSFRFRSALVQSSCLSLLALAVYVPSAVAAVPSVVVDAQQTIGVGYNAPQAVATYANTNKNALFIADTDNNQIIALVGGFNYVVTPTGITLSTPQAVAVDAQGDLFIGDTPTVNGSSVGRITEMTASNGNLTGAAQVLFQGAPLANPISLAVDSAGTLFIGDYPDSGNGAIYSLAAGATTPQLLTFSNVPATLTPAALLRDASNNLYFTDNNSLNGGVYIAPTTGGVATAVATPSLTINQPSGLALDPAGNLYIASLIGSGSSGQQITVVPAASPTTPYILPNDGISSAPGMVFDVNGNLDVLSFVDGKVFQLAFGGPINLGPSSPTAAGNTSIFNFEFNAPATLRGFRVVSGGDVSTEVTQVSGGSCVNGGHNTVGGSAVSAANPYTCNETYQGTPIYPGLRNSAIEVKGPSPSLLATVPVYQISYSAVEVTYPLTGTTTASGLQEPQAVAISGLNKTVYVADTAAGLVYSTNGLNGTNLTPVSTGSITLTAPSGLAVDAVGNLYIADFGPDTSTGQIVEVPVTGSPVVVNTGSLVQHPISLTIDTVGTLYIGDAGPGGQDASSSNPGFIIKVPPTGPAVLFNTSTLPIVFPQALGIYFYTNSLVVGDGGDLSGTGQVAIYSADGTQGSQLPLQNVTDPTGIAVDPAGDVYILDGVTNAITVDPIYQNGGPAYNLAFDNSSLSSASAMAISAGGQSFVIAGLGGGTSNSLLYVNGNKSTLAFGRVKVNTQSQPLTATVANIGNAYMILGTPYFSSTTSNAEFGMLNSSTCAPNVSLPSSGTCTVNFEFTPTATGATNQQFTFNSNAYNTGIPTLTVQGNGSATGSVAKTPKK